MDAITSTLNMLAIGALPAAWALLWYALRRRGVSRWKPAAVGALTFVVAARVLEPLALQASGLMAWASAQAPAPVWVIFAFALAAGLFEEVGRAVGLVSVSRPGADRCAATWSFAAGYAGAELLLIGVVGHGQLLAIAQSADGGAAVLQALPPEARANLQRALEALGPLTAFWVISERLAAVVFQIGLTLLVSGAIQRRSPGPWAAALGLHVLVDLPAAAYQTGHVTLWIVEVIYLAAGAAAAWGIHRYRLHGHRDRIAGGPRRAPRRGEHR